MDDKSMLQSCIAQCRDAKDDIQSISQKATNSKAKDELSKAVQSIDSCINQCQTALTSL
ncbi:MAG: hypothetical protein ACM3UZ_13080 [Acidobacteriota bacterium]